MIEVGGMKVDSNLAGIALNINGQSVRAKRGATILEAAIDAGIYIPALCACPGLKPLAAEVPDRACQLCVAEAGGEIILSCLTPVSEGMVVQTNTPKLMYLRRRNLTAILRRHPNTCFTCDRRKRCGPFDICLRQAAVEERCVTCPKNGNCELQRAVDHIGIEGLPPYTPKKLPLRTDSPFFIRDHNLCILCERCVRVCEEIRGAKAIGFAYPCYRACPSGIDIPRYVRLIARGRPGAALAVIREKVPFPGSLGRVCIHPCETACQRGQAVDKPICIRMLKRFAFDNDDSWKKRSKKLPPTEKKVAVVGAGPAGLTAAYYLAKLGHSVTVFDALPEPGGMMRVGIPEYRLPRKVLGSEIEDISSAGVEIKLNTRIEAIDPLFDQGYEAIFLAVGAHQGMRLAMEGEALPGVIESVEFLRRVNLGERINPGQRVGVVGGGNVAIDSARVSLRLGAKKVTIFYRRTRVGMPARSEEVDAALEEGVEIAYLAAPSKLTRKDGNLQLELLRMELGEPDASGRSSPVPIKGSEYVTELDTLITAIGQRPEVSRDFKVKLGRGNTVEVDADMKTSRQGVFSGGDCTSGSASVIEAIAAGRKAAEAIDRYLGGKGDISESLVPPEEAMYWLEESFLVERLAALSRLSPETSAKSFEEAEHGFGRDVAIAEAMRCLECYVITPPDELLLQDANCQFCGACVDACPTGALLERGNKWVGQPDREMTTTCPYCGVGCQLDIQIKGGKIINSVPNRDSAVNKGQACVKGKFGLDFVYDGSRLTSPLVKRDGEFVAVTWEEALEVVANRLAKYKGNQFAAIASAKCTNEDNYVIQKFARVVMSTNNIDYSARLRHTPTMEGLIRSFGSDAMTNSIGEIGEAACILAIGSDTTETHPVIAVEIRRALRQGGKLIVANPRGITLCRLADLWLQHRPGTDVALLMGMMWFIVDEGLLDISFLRERSENFEAFLDSLKSFHPGFVEKVTGVSADLVAAAARIYATQKPAMIIYNGEIMQYTHGMDNVLAVADAAMLTGNIGKPSTGVNPLRVQNNLQGACDMGALPDFYTGYQPVADPDTRKKFGEAWGSTLSANPGRTLSQIYEAAYLGPARAIYLVGDNPVLSEPNARRIQTSLEKLEFLVVQDIFLTETARLAHVVLPATSFAEKEGTFTNTERRVQMVRQAIEPLGDSKPDWWITAQIAKKMGCKGFDYERPSQIMEEISRLTPSYGGITYQRIEKGGIQWPCPVAGHPGTPILHKDIFARGRGRFAPLEYKTSAQAPDEEYPLILTTERRPYHASTMTGKSKSLSRLWSEELVEINPADAQKLGIADGEMVKVISRRGEVTAKAKVTSASLMGVVNMAVHSADSPMNVLTNPALDMMARIPELKVCAVRVEPQKA